MKCNKKAKFSYTCFVSILTAVASFKPTSMTANMADDKMATGVSVGTEYDASLLGSCFQTFESKIMFLSS